VRDGSTPILLRVLLFMRFRVYPGLVTDGRRREEGRHYT